MKLYLRDYRSNTSGWPNGTSDIVSADAIGSDTDDLPGADNDPFKVVFLHTDNPGTRDAWIRALGGRAINVLVLINAGGRSQATRPPADVFPCYWDPREFVTHPRPQQLIEQIKAGNQAGIDWGLLQPENSEALLAARLLLDAEKLHCAKQQEVCPGITISRPDAALLVEARRVIETREAREPLDAAVREFCEKLRVVSA